MNYKAIFKMEMFKFYKESPFFIAILVIAALNNLCALFVALTVENFASSSAFNLPVTLIYAILPFSIMAALVMIAVYPIQSFSIDYKNNVMATIVASGVDRVKLYYTKVLAILINTFLITVVTLFIPFLIIGALNYSGSDFIGLLGSVFEQMMESPITVVYFIAGSLCTLATIVFAAIRLKGSYMAILLYFLFSMGMSMLSVILLAFFPDSYTIQISVQIVYQITFIVLFVYLAIRTLKNQDL